MMRFLFPGTVFVYIALLLVGYHFWGLAGVVIMTIGFTLIS